MWQFHPIIGLIFVYLSLIVGQLSTAAFCRVVVVIANGSSDLLHNSIVVFNTIFPCAITHKIVRTQSNRKQTQKETKIRFSHLLRYPAWKGTGPILISVLHKFVTYLPTYLRPWDRHRAHCKLHDTRLTASFSRTTWVSWYQKAKPLWISTMQEMMGWQWH